MWFLTYVYIVFNYMNYMVTFELVSLNLNFFDRKRVVGVAGNANRPYKKLNSGGW
jgi:hypothetical protein